MPHLISLTGYATSGKDTIADILVEKHNYVKLGWSDTLYDILYETNPLIPVDDGHVRLQELIDDVGWTDAKKNPEVRELLQRLGTEGIRKSLGEESFISATLPKARESMLRGKNVVITNTRFPNEAKAVNSEGGIIVKVSRPGVEKVNKHSSDQGLAFDYASLEIENDGTIEDLEEKVSVLQNSLKFAFNGDGDIDKIDPYISEVRLEAAEMRAISRAFGAVLEISRPNRSKPSDMMSKDEFLASQKINDLGNREWQVHKNGVFLGNIELDGDSIFIETYINP